MSTTFLVCKLPGLTQHSPLLKQRYLLSLLHKFGLAGAKQVATPIASGTSLSATNDTLLSDPMPFCQFMGSLQYLTLTRPDISYAIHHVCQYMHAPREPHLIVV